MKKCQLLLTIQENKINFSNNQIVFVSNFTLSSSASNLEVTWSSIIASTPVFT